MSTWMILRWSALGWRYITCISIREDLRLAPRDPTPFRSLIQPARCADEGATAASLLREEGVATIAPELSYPAIARDPRGAAPSSGGHGEDCVGLRPIPRRRPPDSGEIKLVTIGKPKAVVLALAAMPEFQGRQEATMARKRSSARTTVNGRPPGSFG